MRYCLYAGLVLLLLLSLVACEEEGDLDNIRQKGLDLVNEYRTEGCTCGSEVMPPVDPIDWNTTIAQVAQAHSADMRSRRTMSHMGSDGSSPGERLTRGGYSWRNSGENVAVGMPTITTVIEGWIGSTGHCKNIMNANFTEMGIARDGDYWTQVFATPR